MALSKVGGNQIDTVSGDLTVDTNTLVVDSTNNNVGIGNSSPSTFTLNSSPNLVVGTGAGSEGITVYSGNDASGCLTFADGTSGAQQYAGFMNYNHDAEAFQVGIGGSERFRFTTGGIAIGGTGSANTLNDYEEGGYVPSATSGITINNVRQATYTKVGRSVTVGFWINADITSTDFIIAGLPFSIFGRAGGCLSNQNLRETLAVTSITTSIYVYGATTGTDDEILFFLTHDT